MLYKMYLGFKCRVRIGGALSDWYNKSCGIHQGRYLAKCNVDQIMLIAHRHSRKWRYYFNARISAVVVSGKTTRETTRYQHERNYRISF